MARLPEWVRETSEPQIRDLGAWRCPDDDWRVTVSVAEFIYGDDEPLLSEFLEASKQRFGRSKASVM